jgi:hypothetical protein
MSTLAFDVANLIYCASRQRGGSLDAVGARAATRAVAGGRALLMNPAADDQIIDPRIRVCATTAATGSGRWP